MPQAKRRCSKYPTCKNWAPCPIHPARYSEKGRNDLPTNWKQLRKRVIGRDGPLCKLKWEGCDGWGRALDHAIPRFYFRDRGLPEDHSLSNLQWICDSCHHLKGKEDLKRYKKR